jgi:hypothetical protein
MGPSATVPVTTQYDNTRRVTGRDGHELEDAVTVTSSTRTGRSQTPCSEHRSYYELLHRQLAACTGTANGSTQPEWSVPGDAAGVTVTASYKLHASVGSKNLVDRRPFCPGPTQWPRVPSTSNPST